MKCSILFLITLLNILAAPVFLKAQTGTSSYELKNKLRQLSQRKDYLKDTNYLNTLTRLAYIYSYTYPDSALLLLSGNVERCDVIDFKEGEVTTYMITGDAFQTKGKYDSALENYNKAYKLAKHINYKKEFSLIENRIGTVHLNQGNYPQALNEFYEALQAAEAQYNNDLIGATLNNIAIVHYYQGKYNEAENDYTQRLKLAQQMADSSGMSLAYNGLGEVNLQQKNFAKALLNLNAAYNIALKVNDEEMLLTVSLSTAEAYYQSDSLQKAIMLFQNALRLSKQMSYSTYISNALIGLARVYYKQGLLKEALADGLEGLQTAETMGQVQLMRDANEILSNIYNGLNDDKNALKYYRSYKIYSDSINSLASERAAAAEKANYEFSKKENAFQRKTLQQQWIIFSALAGVVLLAVILWIIIRNRNRINSTYKELQKKNKEVEIQKSKAEQTLSELKATQQQLIQSEKMASLGELTAGIAHEIQNPLNFVNNFSEVTNELIDEMKEGILKNNYEDVNALADDVKQNLEKINHHGKRADAIVRGMLQHSRQSKSIKEPTDINALCNEYLRLNYHGLRAKDKNFNAVLTEVAIKTDFDESIGKINIVPQDIGRVLLNLFNNAFYAVNERQKLMAESYQPTAEIKTRKVNDKIEIMVSDNGNGIPSNIINKIFQPFFTTKPTGQGTGLGLSLAYDIITKEHNGTIKVESKEGEGATFTIILPVV